MEERKLHLDFETRSTVPFGKSAGPKGVNAQQYARHPTTEIRHACWAVNDEPVQHWHAWRGDPAPDELLQLVADGWTVCAHNAGFEQAIWEAIMVPLHDAPLLPIEQMDCTAARAAIMALPRDLAGVGKALGLDIQKDDEGHKVMLKVSKPRAPKKATKTRQAEDPTQIYWVEDEALMLRQGQYCETDVEVERMLDKLLKPMSTLQRQQWLRVHRANMRGVMVDIDFVERAKAVVQSIQQGYDKRFAEITDGAVKSATDLMQMKAWLGTRGIDASVLDKGAVIDLLKHHEDDQVACEVLQLRQEAGKSSVAKLERFSVLTGEQRRMLENFLFHAANTGRLGGRGAQLQNLPSRGGLPWYDAERCIDIILSTQDPEWAALQIELLYGEVPTALSSCLRGVIMAPPGKKLFVADFSNIEGRVGAWLGNEKWKLEGFRRYDTVLGIDSKGDKIRGGPDLYKVTAGMVLGKTPDQVNKAERNVLGKVSDLALLFGGGVGAYQSMANIYHVNMAEYWEVIRGSLDEQFVEKARWAWGKFGAAQAASMDMSEAGWLASETVKNAWRDRHPGIVKAWATCESLSVAALERPGKWFPWADGRCAIGAQEIGGKMFLVYRLPSGRKLYRCDAHLKATKKFGRTAREIRFMGVDSTTKQWVRMSTYGGDTFQSCLGAGTMVLTKDGWTPIERITSQHQLWDGQQWVGSDGAVCNGLRHTIDLNGVRVTPEHLVLTHDGWKEASQSAGHYRAQSRLPDGFALHWLGWEEIPVAGGMCLRGTEDVSGQRPSEGQPEGADDVMRMPALRDDQRQGDPARNVTPPRLRCLGLDDQPLLSGEKRFVCAIRRSRHNGLSALARQLPGLLGGHGVNLSSGSDAGTQTGERHLRAGQLRLGDVGAAGTQQAQEHTATKWLRTGDIEAHRHFQEHAVLPPGKRLAFGSTGDSPRPAEPVYDILNAGPRNRFVVRDAAGQPLIVHNCVQAIAYDLMDSGWANVEADGFDVILSVHDEIGAEAEAERRLEDFEAGMNRTPAWAEGCPVSSEGYVADRYRKDG